MKKYVMVMGLLTMFAIQTQANLIPLRNDQFLSCQSPRGFVLSATNSLSPNNIGKFALTFANPRDTQGDALGLATYNSSTGTLSGRVARTIQVYQQELKMLITVTTGTPFEFEVNRGVLRFVSSGSYLNTIRIAGFECEHK